MNAPLAADEKKLKHLEFLQNVITRMAHNSFLLKGWSITVIAAMLAFLKDVSGIYIFTTLIPAVAFWLLDAFFLRQERLFRALYNSVVGGEPSIPEFSMDTSKVADKVASLESVAMSQTLLVFHGAVLIVIAVVGTLKQCLVG